MPVTPDEPAPDAPAPDGDVPGLTACALCAGETLGADDPLPGGQLARLRALADRDAARLTEVDCLDACERGDVVVARPSGPSRRAGAGPVWFERLSGDADTAALEGWLRAGGPGRGPVPPGLSDRVIRRGAGPEDLAADAG